MNQPEITVINTSMRDAFMSARITQGTNSKLVLTVARAARAGMGAIKRRKLWNKAISKG